MVHQNSFDDGTPLDGQHRLAAILAQKKRCSKCGEVKLLTEFGRLSRAPSGLMYACKRCEQERNRNMRSRGGGKKPSSPRRALPDSARDVGWALRKDIERIERIFADDRYSTYKLQVAMELRGHLEYTAKVCRDLLNGLTQTGD